MANKILIIGSSWVGDAVMSQTLFKLIKQQNPAAQIDVLAPAWTFSLLSCMPEVANVIPSSLTHGEIKLRARYQLAKKLRAQQYDQAIVLPGSFKSALIPWLAGIAQRTGWRGEYRYGLLNDLRVLDKKRYPLMIEQYMALALPANTTLSKPYPLPAFHVADAAKTAVLEKHKLLQRHRPILALCPGAEFGPSKRWPEEYYAQVAKQKLAEDWDVWLLGSKKDGPVLEKIMALTDDRCENLAGRLELAEAVTVLSLVSGVVSNDSGLMHVAAALNKPVVAVYGSTSPAFTPPLSPQATVLQLALPCQPCFARTCPLGHHQCMRDLTPERVLAVLNGWKLGDDVK
jgi:heptosyltransferase-2